MKECIQCQKMGDEWKDFTRTNDGNYEVDICQSCRIKNLGDKI